MSKLLRLGLTFVVTVGSLVGISSGIASAGSGASTVPFVTTPLTVGEVATFSIVIANDNANNAGENFDFAGATNTVCNQVPQASTNCSTLIEGISYTPSCGLTGAFSVCAQPDPDVFELAPTATGIAGTCVGMAFDVEPLNDADGRYRFTPAGGVSITLPGAGAECQIEFDATVLRIPTIDSAPGVNGVQTIAITDHTQSVAGTSNTASARGQSQAMTINRAVPTILTDATPPVVLGAGTLADTARTSGRRFPTDGSISFRLYGPDDVDCSGTPVFADLNVPYPATPRNNAVVTSQSFTPVLAGTYRWVATYNGDTNNTRAVGTCGDPTETRLVAKASPTIDTTASAAVKLGEGDLVDTATVTGMVNPQAGATVTFNLYGPNDTQCANAPVATSTLPYPTAGGPIDSLPYTPLAPGSYQWVATYSGDANNNAAAGDCGDTTEITAVAKAIPAIVTTASGDVAVGGELTDSATVTGRVSPLASTIEFSLYGPDNDTCTGTPVFTSFGVPYGPASTSVTSEPFTPTLPGTYRWVATYTGDANNRAVTGTCGDPAETVQVFGGLSRIVTTASAGTFVGDGKALSDVATVLDRVAPDGSGIVDFRLYGPNDATCSGTPVFQSLNVAYPASGGTVSSAGFVPTAPGTYRWVATYRGDSNNSGAEGVCGDPAETVEVAPTPSVDIELPATGPGGVAGTMTFGFGLLLAGVALLGVSGRRRRFGNL